MNVIKSLNGHKKYIIPAAGLIPLILFLLGWQFGYNKTVTANETTLVSHATAITDLKQAPVQIARLEENVKYIQKDVEEIKSNVELILKAVVK